MRLVRLGCLAATLCVSSVSNAQLQPLGDVFQVDTSTQPRYASDPAVAVANNGNVMVVWSTAGSTVYFGVFGRLYDRSGLPLGEEFQITHDLQSSSATIAAGGGRFVVIWSGAGRIFGRRYDSTTGIAEGAIFEVDAYEPPGNPNVGCNSAGNCAVVWESAASTISQQYYDSQDRVVGHGAVIAGNNFSVQARPHAAVHADGTFIVVWHRIGSNFGDSAVYGQRYGRNGLKVGNPLEIATTLNRTEGYDAQGLAIAGDPSGSSFVAWDSQIGAGESGFAPNPGNIFAQQVGRLGERIGSQPRVTTDNVYFGFFPTLTADSAGNFLLAWREITHGGGRIAVQYLGAGATPLAPVVRLPTDKQPQNQVAIVADDQATVTIVWDSGIHIYAQRYQLDVAPPAPTPTPTVGPPPAVCVGDCNGDGTVTADEIMTGVNIALMNDVPGSCPAFECNGAFGGVSINCLIDAVENTLGSCPPP